MQERRKLFPNFKRFFRFRLSVMLLVLLVISIPLSMVARELNNIRQVKAFLGQDNVSAQFHEQSEKRMERNWLRRQFDYEEPQSVVIVDPNNRDLEMAGRLSELERLALIRPATISDLTPLASLKKLEHVRLNSNDQLERLGGRKKWEWAANRVIPKSAIRELAFLEGMKDLRDISCFDTSVADISSLRNLQQLFVLKLSHTNVKDLTPISGLKNLTYLDISCTEVSDLTPLSDLTKLTDLDISFTQVSDLEPIEKTIPSLKWLYLVDTNVKDLSPLSSGNNLQVIHVTKDQFDQSHIRELPEHIQNCITEIDFLEPFVDPFPDD
jgi:Leucine-rich repeat (LRR) protein